MGAVCGSVFGYSVSEGRLLPLWRPSALLFLGDGVGRAPSVHGALYYYCYYCYYYHHHHDDDYYWYHYYDYDYDYDYDDDYYYYYYYD